MRLIWKFNLMLLAIFALGFAVAGFSSWRVLQANAREEVLQHARLMMESALAARTYTTGQIKPLLEGQLQSAFLPQSVPAYAATEQFNELRKKHPEYGYKEATLNPSNPRDRAVDWEADVINVFRQDPRTPELVGERETPTGPSLYLARPVQITNPACLACHSTVEAAPKTMIDLYGAANGFGWKMDEVIGVQLVSVPMAVPIERARASFATFMGALGAVFLATFVLLNAMLHLLVIRRITRLANLADQVSLGNLDAGEFRSGSRDESGTLTEALGRMKASLVSAIRMLEDPA